MHSLGIQQGLLRIHPDGDGNGDGNGDVLGIGASLTSREEIADQHGETHESGYVVFISLGPALMVSRLRQYAG